MVCARIFVCELAAVKSLATPFRNEPLARKFESSLGSHFRIRFKFLLRKARFYSFLGNWKQAGKHFPMFFCISGRKKRQNAGEIGLKIYLEILDIEQKEERKN